MQTELFLHYDGLHFNIYSEDDIQHQILTTITQEQSLMVWDSSSSQLTLLIMLSATVLFLPIILIYTAWVYRVLRGKITEQTIHDNLDTAY